MSVHDSAVDPAALAFARALLRPPVRRETLWSPLLASAFAAMAALALATAMLMSPPLISDAPVRHLAKPGAVDAVLGPEKSR
ncbi:MAG: hypothetical protein JWP35_1457 [Caulobacter sp.]|nr:hypothetical protein [Caulobacter sp.]